MRDTGLVAAYRAVGAVVFVIGRVVFAARAAAVLADDAVVRISLVNLARSGITVLALRAIVILTYVRCALDRYAAVLANGAIGCRRTVITNGSDMLTVFAGGVAKVLTFESIYEYNQCRLYKDGKFDMLHGQDETILPSLAMGGAQGGIGGTTNYNGKELVGIIDAWKAGDLELARERQNFSQEVINVICHYRGNIVGGKRIMKLIGLDLGKNRTPFQNMTDEEEAAMKAELEAINFFERCNKF